jgi:hypothetical protein
MIKNLIERMRWHSMDFAPGTTFGLREQAGYHLPFALNCDDDDAVTGIMGVPPTLPQFPCTTNVVGWGSASLNLGAPR